MQQHRHQRVATSGLQPPQLLRGHAPAERLERAATSGWQRSHVDLSGAQRDEPAVLRDLAEQLLDSGRPRRRRSSPRLR
jgi:hypothetical protein